MWMTVRSPATSSACGRSSARWTLSSTRSRPSMASATDTGSPERQKPERGRRPRGRFRGLPGAALGRVILALNLLGLAILISGALVLNELRRGLVNARVDSLSTQGELIANLINQAATIGEPEPEMDAAVATEIMPT